MENTLKTTLIQTALHWENVDANLEMFEKKLAAITMPTDLIILPEMFSTGFSMNATRLAETMEGMAVQWMVKKSAEKNAVVTGSLIIREGGQYFNRLIWMQPDGQYACYDKRHLFRMGEEHKNYTPGNKRLVVEWKGWKFCPQVCYDLRFPVWNRNRFRERPEYDCLLFVANWPRRRSDAWKTLLQARAIENLAYVIGANRVGEDGKQVYHSGDSSVVDFKGDVLYRKADKEDIHSFTLEYQTLEEFRKTFPALLDGDEFTINV